MNVQAQAIANKLPTKLKQVAIADSISLPRWPVRSSWEMANAIALALTRETGTKKGDRGWQAIKYQIFQWAIVGLANQMPC